MALVRRILNLRLEEQPSVALLAVVYILFSAGSTWSAGILTALILTEYGLTFYASAMVLFGLATILVATVYTVAVDRVPSRRLLLALSGLAALVAAAGGLLLTAARGPAILLLFVLAETLHLVWMIHWKTTLAALYDTRASRRILPLLGSAQLVGIAAGGLAMALLLQQPGFHPDGLIGLWVGSLVLMTLLLALMPRLLPEPAVPRITEGYFASLSEGFLYVRRSGYLRWLAASIALMTALVVLVQFKVAEQALAYFAAQLPLDTDGQARAIGGFFALVDALAALLMLPVALVVFPRLLERFGTGGMNLFYPLLSLVVTLLFILALTGLLPAAPALLLTGLAHIDRTAFRRVFRASINALLYNAVPPYMKGRARSVTNGLLAPLAIIGTGLAVQVAGAALLSLILFLLALGYVLTAVILRRRYAAAMLDLVARQDYGSLLEAGETGHADPATLRLLAQRLRDTRKLDDATFLVHLLLAAGGEEALPLLLDDAATRGGDEDWQLMVMQAVQEAGLTGSQARLFFINHIAAEDRLLRRIALLGLLNTMTTDPAAAVRLALDYLHDPDHVVRGRMLTTLLRQGDALQKDRARRVLNVMLRLQDSESRAEAVQALVNVGEVRHIIDLVQFVTDGDDEVRLVAIRGIQTLWRDDLPAEVLEAVLAHEHYFLEDRVERVRQEELRLLRLIGGEVACQALVRGLTDSSAAVRDIAQESLIELGGIAETYLLQARQSPDAALVRQAVLTLARLNPARYRHEVLQLVQATLLLYDEERVTQHLLYKCRQYASFDVLIRVMQQTMQRLQDDIFALLAQVYGAGTIYTLRDGLAAGGPDADNALESLEALAGAEIARRIAPMYAPQTLPPLTGTRNTQEVIRELATGPDTFLRAVTIAALGELCATYPAVQRLVLEKPDVPDASLNLCQSALDPQIVAVLLRTALASQDAGVRVAARSALRRIKGEDIIQTKQAHEEEAVLSTIERMIYLRRLAYFQPLNVEQLAAVAGACEEQLFRKDAVLFRQGDPGGVVYIVISGEVDIGLREGPGWLRLAAYPAGTVFGEMSLFDNNPRSAEALALRDTLVLTLRRDVFLGLMRQFPEMSVQLVATLSGRLRQANSHIAELRSTLSQRSVEV